MTELSEAQRLEIEKYERAYKHDRYGMGKKRMAAATRELAQHATPGAWYLDVGCGRAEMLDVARGLGLQAYGVEPVSYLTDRSDVAHGVAWALPFRDGTFDIVSIFDVLEHLLRDDLEPTLRELLRVCRPGGVVILAAASFPNQFHGDDLHITLLTASEWDALFRDVFGEEHTITKSENPEGACSETWVVRRAEEANTCTQ